MKSLATIGLLLVTATNPLVAQSAPPPPLTVAASTKSGYATIKRYVVATAASFPEAEFGFKPTPQVRSFGEILGHIVNFTFTGCAVTKGEPNPNKQNFETTPTKPVLTAALDRAFAYCDAALEGLDEASSTQTMKVGAREVVRIVPIISMVAHANEHYGNLVTYMRLKGVVPPSTEMAQKPAAQ